MYEVKAERKQQTHRNCSPPLCSVDTDLDITGHCPKLFTLPEETAAQWKQQFPSLHVVKWKRESLLQSWTKTGINFNWQSMTELQRSMLNPCVDETFSEEFSCSLLVLMTFSQPSVADILISAAEWRWGCCSWSWQCCYFIFLKGPLKIPFELLCFCMISIIVVCFCIKEKSSVKCGKLLKSSQPEATLTPKPTTVTSG